MLVFAVAMLSSGSGCSRVAEQGACLNERTRPAVVRWGDYDTKSGQLRAYQFAGSLELATVRRETYQEQPEVAVFQPLDGRVFCTWLRKTLDVFEQIQTLNAPGEMSRYVEYSTPKTTIRAVWNPKFQTYGSKEFRALYDSLMTLVPAGKRWE